MVHISTCPKCKSKVVAYSGQFNTCKNCGNEFFSEAPKIKWNKQNYEKAKRSILKKVGG